jgi:hypothetical protein
MLQTIEGIIDQNGIIQLLEAAALPPYQRVLVTLLESQDTATAQRPFGLCEGEFVVPDDFDAPLPTEILDAFEGA